MLVGYQYGKAQVNVDSTNVRTNDDCYYGNRNGRVLYERAMIATSVITYEVGRNTGFDTN